jgi:hypothetical protein
MYANIKTLAVIAALARLTAEVVASLVSANAHKRFMNTTTRTREVRKQSLCWYLNISLNNM